MASTKAKRRGARDYIFQRRGSPNFYIKLRSPAEPGEKKAKRIEKCLNTTDRAVAEIRSLPMIAEHKARLLAARPRIETTWQHKLEPGREHAAPDGGKIVATDRQLIHIGPNGSIKTIEPNGSDAFQLVSRSPLTVHTLAEAFINSDVFGEPSRRTVTTKTNDDALFQTYIDKGARKGRGLDGYERKEAEAAWDLFRSLTNAKALKECGRNDGRLLVDHYKAKGNSYPTIQKKVMWLCAMVEFSMVEKTLPAMVNPFSGIVPQETPQEKIAKRRKSLDNADIKACKAKLATLSKSDQLLFRLLEATGMRLSEAFQISGEEPHNGGPRFCIVGNKSENSLRRVPFPKSVLPYLPAKVKRPLFDGLTSSASHRFTEFLRDTVGIKDPKKVLYSLRHRAKDRLRDLDCPEKISEALFGRDEVTTGDGYGKGYSIRKLKTWADKISAL
jgi:integrase